MTTIRYGTVVHTIKEYSIKGEVYKTICLEGDEYSLEDDLAGYKNIRMAYGSAQAVLKGIMNISADSRISLLTQFLPFVLR